MRKRRQSDSFFNYAILLFYCILQLLMFLAVVSGMMLVCLIAYIMLERNWPRGLVLLAIGVSLIINSIIRRGHPPHITGVLAQRHLPMWAKHASQSEVFWYSLRGLQFLSGSTLLILCYLFEIPPLVTSTKL